VGCSGSRQISVEGNHFTILWNTVGEFGIPETNTFLKIKS